MKSLRTDMIIDNKKNYTCIKRYKNIEILENRINKNIYHTIKFYNIENSKNIIRILKKEINFFINNKIKHVLIVGLGNEDNTADSIGPKTIKNIKVNFKLEHVNNKNNIKISALIPGVLGTTGINTDKIINSVINNIKPDLIILIDSMITNNINFINKTIEISNSGIKPGSGLFSNNKEISKKTVNKPIITIGIPTALEYIFNNTPLLLTPSNIDCFVNNISKIIATAINEIFYNELIDTPV